MKRWVFFFLFFPLCHLWAQTASSTFYREDQLFINTNLILQENSTENFKQNGFSRSVHMGFLRDIPMNNKGNKAIALGLGYGYNYLINNLQIKDQQDEFIFSLPPDSSSNLRNQLGYHQVLLPVELRWRNSTSTNYQFWRIYLGYRLSYVLRANYKPFFGRSFLVNDQLTDIQQAITLSVGYNTWNLHFQYELFPVFKQNLQKLESYKPTFHLLQIGLIFYFL